MMVLEFKSCITLKLFPTKFKGTKNPGLILKQTPQYTHDALDK